MHRKSLVKTIGFGLAALIITVIPGRTYAETNLMENIIQSEEQPDNIEIESLEDGETKETAEITGGNEEAPKDKAPNKEEVPPIEAPTEEVAPPIEAPTEEATPPIDAPTEEATPPIDVPTEEVAPPIEAPTEEAAPPMDAPAEEEAPSEDEEKLEQDDKSKQESQESKEELAISRIHAGTAVYAEDLKQQYNLAFSDDIGEVMEEIEEEYIQENEISREENQKIIRANNWQDIYAVYILQQQKEGKTSFHISRDSKEGLKEVYKEMNRLVVVKQEDSKENRNLLHTNLNTNPVQYENLDVEEVIRRNRTLNKPIYGQNEEAFLEKYSSEECMILCAAATNAQGFIRQSLSAVSEERKAVVESAYSLVGKIAYFWGGKSTAIGWDERWGGMEKVSAAGSQESGTIREYGLDCSGFVSWAFLNGAHNSDADISVVGAGTGGQWHSSTAVSEQEALPGDLVFLSPQGNSASAEHIGIVIGKTTKGDLIAVHCNATDNGVTVQSAYEAGFRYVRSPRVFSGGDQINHN